VDFRWQWVGSEAELGFEVEAVLVDQLAGWASGKQWDYLQQVG